RSGALQFLDVDPGPALELALALALRLRDEIDLPAREPRGEARVLAALSDRERELVVRHGDQHLLLRLHHLRLDHLGGREGARDEDDRIAAPGNDVDLLAPQLANDGLDARALDADAGAHRIDLVVVRDDRDLRARAGLAGDALD